MSVHAATSAPRRRPAGGAARQSVPRVSRHLELVRAVPDTPRGFQEPTVFVELEPRPSTPLGFQDPDVFGDALALLAPTRPVAPAPQPLEPAPVRPWVRKRAAGRVRLTRRGRIVVFGLLLSTCLVLVGLLAQASQAATPITDRPVVVVEPGDTLWSLAERAVPGADPRLTAEQIRRLNELPDHTISAGQRLWIPVAS